MTFENKEKQALMNARYEGGASLSNIYVALGSATSGTELANANGYNPGARPAIPRSGYSVSSSGVLTITAGQTLYTATTGNAVRARSLRLSAAASGDADWIHDAWISLGASPPNAPGNGQALQTGTITLSA